MTSWYKYTDIQYTIQYIGLHVIKKIVGQWEQWEHCKYSVQKKSMNWLTYSAILEMWAPIILENEKKNVFL